ncbi:MAG: NTP transferase domain-containing protein [Bryobacterales bacterium]|nr:NTP transferase domain-containing protein [Bryobacterales bacterium]
MQKAVVLAAGRGSRMKALTADRPKPMLELAGKPLLEHILDRLAEARFEEVLVVTGYRAEMIENYFADYPVLHVSFRRQTEANGTGSATRLAEEWVGDSPFLLTFGDIVMEAADYRAMAGMLESDPEVAAVAAVKWVADPAAGAAVYEENHRITRIVEKPAPGTSTTNWNSAGTYTFRPAVFAELRTIPVSPRGEYEVTSAVHQLIAEGRKVMMHALAGDWRDVGRPEDLAVAEQMLD